jgi:hypothetical protein
MPKSIQPAPILFYLNNNPPNSEHNKMIVAFFNLLLMYETSCIHNFIRDANCFTKDQFTLLHNRIMSKLNKQVPMNERHLIILYSVLYFIYNVLDNEDEIKILLDGVNDIQVENHEKVIEAIRIFSKKTLDELFTLYQKNNNIKATIAKINTIKVGN